MKAHNPIINYEKKIDQESCPLIDYYTQRGDNSSSVYLSLLCFEYNVYDRMPFPKSQIQKFSAKTGNPNSQTRDSVAFPFW